MWRQHATLKHWYSAITHKTTASYPTVTKTFDQTGSKMDVYTLKVCCLVCWYRFHFTNLRGITLKNSGVRCYDNIDEHVEKQDLGKEMQRAIKYNSTGFWLLFKTGPTLMHMYSIIIFWKYMVHFGLYLMIFLTFCICLFKTFHLSHSYWTSVVQWLSFKHNTCQACDWDDSTCHSQFSHLLQILGTP